MTLPDGWTITANLSTREDPAKFILYKDKIFYKLKSKELHDAIVEAETLIKMRKENDIQRSSPKL